jgi:hypothetical protein
VNNTNITDECPNGHNALNYMSDKYFTLNYKNAGYHKNNVVHVIVGGSECMLFFAKE